MWVWLTLHVDLHVDSEKTCSQDFGVLAKMEHHVRIIIRALIE